MTDEFDRDNTSPEVALFEKVLRKSGLEEVVFENVRGILPVEWMSEGKVTGVNEVPVFYMEREELPYVLFVNGPIWNLPEPQMLAAIASAKYIVDLRRGKRDLTIHFMALGAEKKFRKILEMDSDKLKELLSSL